MSVALEPRAVRTMREAYELIEDAEREGTFLDVRLGDYCVWPVVRRQVMAALTGTSFAVDMGAHQSLGALGMRFAAALADTAAYVVLRPARWVFNTHTTSLTYLRDGAFRDFFADEVITRLDSTAVLETANSVQLARRRPQRGRRYITTSAIQAGVAIGGRALRSRDVKRAANDLADRLHETIGAEAYDRAWIHAALAHFDWSRRLHDVMIRRLRPEGVVLIDWSQHGLVAAARDRGAEVVEMQHGFLDRYHSAYGWQDAAVSHREAMPVADRFLAFGDYWVGEMTHGAFWRGRVSAVGSIPLDRVREQASGIRDERHVVVTAQGIQGERVGEYLRAALELMPVDTRLTVKIHPVYNGDANALRAALSGDERACVVTHATSRPLLELIATASVHASISSTSHYEAIALGTPTVVMPFPPSDNVAHLIEAGHATLAATPAELADLVRNQSRHRLSEDISRWYYERGAVENIIRALEDR